MSCNHCEKPACLEKCPAGAYSRRAEDGLVVHDPARCIGCRYCTWACPYGAPQYDARSGRIVKCNMCLGRTAEGEPPACVASCPMRAIEVGSFEEFSVRRWGDDLDTRPAPAVAYPAAGPGTRSGPKPNRRTRKDDMSIIPEGPLIVFTMASELACGLALAAACLDLVSRELRRSGRAEARDLRISGRRPGDGRIPLPPGAAALGLARHPQLEDLAAERRDPVLRPVPGRVVPLFRSLVDRTKEEGGGSWAPARPCSVSAR